MDDSFKIVMPAQLEKAKDGEWKVKGLASTERVDQQGEILIQKGMDLTPIDKKQGYFNFDHKQGLENLVGVIDGYARSPKGLYVEGRLFKNHATAKHLYDIMSSLSEKDSGRIGMSVEGRILERDSSNPKIIKKCQIKNVALTLNPVNSDTYADLAKAMNDSREVVKSLESAVIDVDTTKTFTSDQVVELLQKALGIGPGAAAAPNLRTGGDALQVSNMDEKDKSDSTLNPAGTPEIKATTGQGDERKRTEDSVVMADRERKKLEGEETRKSLKKLNYNLYKSNMIDLLDKLQKLYPEHSRSEIWESVKDRLERKFPEIKEI